MNENILVFAIIVLFLLVMVVDLKNKMIELLKIFSVIYLIGFSISLFCVVLGEPKIKYVLKEFSICFFWLPILIYVLIKK